MYAIAELDGRVLLVRRAREPAAGTLDLPGGFIDFGETAEVALVRELREELDLAIEVLDYLGSYPNVYPYAGVRYHTLDLCFRVRLLGTPDRARVDESELEVRPSRPRSIRTWTTRCWKWTSVAAPSG